MSKSGLNTARITEDRGYFIVLYMNGGSFLVGERQFGSYQDALDFVKERDLYLVSSK